MSEIDLSKTSQRWTGWLAILVVLLGMFAIFLVLSSINAGHMALVVEDGRLYVEKGDFLPWGRSEFVPSEAFEPVHVPDDLDVELPLGECSDRDGCERRFYDSVLILAGALLEEPAPAELARAKELIVRAQLFPSISLAEREPIEDLTGGVHYVEALVMLEDVRARLRAAHKKLSRSRIAGAGDAQKLEILIEMVEAQLNMLDRNLSTDQLDDAEGTEDTEAPTTPSAERGADPPQEVTASPEPADGPI